MEAKLTIEREWEDVLGRKHYHVVEDVVPVMVVHEKGREDVQSEAGGFSTEDEWVGDDQYTYSRLMNMLYGRGNNGRSGNLVDEFL